MATTRPFAYNPGSPIAGTIQVGDLAVGYPTSGYTGMEWWNGPDEDLGYVIAQPVSADTQPTNVFSGNLTLSPTYKGTDISLSNNNQTATQLFGYQQSVLGQTLIDNVDKVMFSVQSNVCAGPGNPFFQSIGVGTTSMNYSTQYGAYPGNDTESVGFSMDGNFYYNGSIVQTSLPTWSVPNDLIDVAVDLSNGLIWIRVNGGYWNNNIYANPTIGTGSLPLYGLTSFYPVLSPGNDVGQMTIQNSAIYGLPEGYQLLGSNVTGSVGFFRTSGFNDNEFVDIANTLLNSNYNNSVEASSALTSNGYWNSYTTFSPVLSLDAADYTSGDWMDSIGGKSFVLYNSPTWSPNNGGYFNFIPTSSQYAICATSLPVLSNWSVGVWHYYAGTNTGALPCIVTETYTGVALNYTLGNSTGSGLSSGFFNGGWQISGGYSLTPNNWYYIVGTYDGTTNNLYVNNTLVASNNYTWTITSQGSGIRLMERWDSYDYWGGKLATVDIYDKALSNSEIESIWNLTKPRFGFGTAVPTVTSDSYGSLSGGSATVTGTITSDGGSAILERGIVWSTSPNPTISNNKVPGTGTAVETFTQTYAIPNPYAYIYVRTYATNVIGTGYGTDLYFILPCFVKGTKITMFDRTKKNIEDISYEDNLLVWNFDDGQFDSAKPLWIMEMVKTPSVNILFSDGSKLGISGYLQHDGGHRIFNLDKGEFTYVIPNEHTPIGTRTFNDKGEIVTIVGKEEGEFAEIYNVVTNRHLNIFAEGALTSRRLNNIYPISDMKFVKEERTITPIEEFMGITEEYYNGLRLGEQPLVKVSEGFLTKSPGELAYTLPTIEELVEWTVGFIQKKYDPVYEDTIS